MPMRQIVLWLCVLTAPVVRAQSLSITPHFNLLFPTCRLADNTEGYETFAPQRFSVFSGDLGVFLEYKSKNRWGISSGISIGAVGLGYKLGYDPGGAISWIEHRNSYSRSLHRVPLLFTYTWKDVHLFQLRNYRKLSEQRRPRVADESILYALVFKVQPIVGASLNYIGELHRWDNPDDTLDIRSSIRHGVVSHSPLLLQQTRPGAAPPAKVVDYRITSAPDTKITIKSRSRDASDFISLTVIQVEPCRRGPVTLLQ